MLLAIFFLLTLISPVYGDDFNNNNDGLYNRYYQTFAISVKEYPEPSSDKNSINYSTAPLSGLSTESVLDNQSILTLTDTGYMRRIPNLVDRVVGPPNTKIDIVYFFYNNTGHNVNISNIAIPLSRNNINTGDWTQIVDSDTGLPEYKSIFVYYNNYSRIKEGKLKEYEGIGLVSEGSMGFAILDTITIKNPIVIKDIVLEEEEEIVNVKVLMKNEGTEKLNNIVFEHESHFEQFILNVGQEYLVEYTLLNEGDLGYFKVTNNNIKTHCVILGSELNNWNSLWGVSALAFRDDGGWVSGAYVQPSAESFCISRTPYSFTSDILRYENIQEDDNILDEDDIDNSVEEESILEQKVLGADVFDEITVLPKTGLM